MCEKIAIGQNCEKKKCKSLFYTIFLSQSIIKKTKEYKS